MSSSERIDAWSGKCYWKVCACWVPRLLIEEQRLKRKSVPSQFLERYAEKPTYFFTESWRVTKAGCVTLIRKETTERGMACKTSPKKKPKTMSSTLRPQKRYFGILVEFLTERGNHQCYSLPSDDPGTQSFAMWQASRRGRITLRHDDAQRRTARMCVEKFRRTAWHFCIHYFRT